MIYPCSILRMDVSWAGALCYERFDCRRVNFVLQAWPFVLETNKLGIRYRINIKDFIRLIIGL